MVVFFAQLLNQHQVLVNTWIFKELIFYKVRVFFFSIHVPPNLRV
jgi:predicted membrane channel-forming protein YqfA (hemolysin III family)